MAPNNPEEILNNELVQGFHMLFVNSLHGDSTTEKLVMEEWRKIQADMDNHIEMEDPDVRNTPDRIRANALRKWVSHVGKVAPELLESGFLQNLTVDQLREISDALLGKKLLSTIPLNIGAVMAGTNTQAIHIMNGMTSGIKMLEKTVHVDVKLHSRTPIEFQLFMQLASKFGISDARLCKTKGANIGTNISQEEVVYTFRVHDEKEVYGIVKGVLEGLVRAGKQGTSAREAIYAGMKRLQVYLQQADLHPAMYWSSESEKGAFDYLKAFLDEKGIE